MSIPAVSVPFRMEVNRLMGNLSDISGSPAQQGLYNPQNEHDACGMGFVVNVKGVQSHSIVGQGLEVLQNIEHRGACGCEPNTGDGAGILTQIPDRFFRSVCEFDLPDTGKYGVGVLFLPREKKKQDVCRKVIADIISGVGQKVLGWRLVPVDNSDIGDTALAGEPQMFQVFVGLNDAIGQDPLEYERILYIIRKLAAKQIHSTLASGYYAASFSSRTVIYKGMFLSPQLETYFPDLLDERYESALAMVHSRFSTNTFPSWERAHPYRYLIHNGEINTVRGNENWMNAREGMFHDSKFGDKLTEILPIIDSDGSDSAKADNALELLYLQGRSLAHVIMMMVPEPWEKHETMDDAKRAFYEYHSCLMEPWDGPASIGFTDGVVVGGTLDRNGLRPSRYYVTKDDVVVLASETGVCDIKPENVEYKGRLEPGRMLLIDTSQGRIISDEEIKNHIANEHPYRKWLSENLLHLADLPDASPVDFLENHEEVLRMQQAFGYTYEDLRVFLKPMVLALRDPVGSMGNDAALAALSDRPQLLYNYFRQHFAQVTNPPLDPLREELVTSAETKIGPEGDLLNPSPDSCRQITLDRPILKNFELEKLRNINAKGHSAKTIPILFDKKSGIDGLESGMELLFKRVDEAVQAGFDMIVLSDRDLDEDNVPIPALLAVSGVHHHLIRNETRTRVGLIIESGEPREVHHFCLLIGYGAQAINPYMAFESLHDMVRENMLDEYSYEEAEERYVYGAIKGVIKVMAKMGISTIKSYRGAQIFEAMGISQSVIDTYFTATVTQIQGMDLKGIAKEAIDRHCLAFANDEGSVKTLSVGGQYQWRQDGEHHLFNPKSIHLLQRATRNNDYDIYKQYAEQINDQSERMATLRSLLELKVSDKSIPIDEVEPIEKITRRFKSGAMSYGSISQEAHETLAIAMNRIGGRSNTGEGGEDPARYTPEPNGDSKNSAIKQIASGRFGVTNYYLTQGEELQIKMAQGAKPGEGGELPGKKVYPWVAKVRHSTPGVELISPPPHHDIYSIEDLAQLIHDLKNVNHFARINVKLVSEFGVGTVAAGVAKGKADVVLISGHDGGTGASPQTSIKYAGLPWELGLAETHQTLVMNKLRSRIVVEADGQLKTGRDVIIAALLGAEEFGFATTALVAMGCIMMRVCHLDTCPVGVATQNPELRKKFTGTPESIVNFLQFVAQDMREIMASMGFRSIDEMVGRTDRLETKEAISHWKAEGIDLTPILYQPDVGPDVGRRCTENQDHGLDRSFDRKTLLDLCKPALENGEKVTASLPIQNTFRVIGTQVGSEITRRFGPDGLPQDTIHLKFTGVAGQSFGAFTPLGMRLEVEGDANDYFGKGLSGARLAIYPPKNSSLKASENVILGNVAFYGATSGEAYIAGKAGERFCVRNSGVRTVVEGVGDHGCEYMTGGRVVILGATGRNFAAGMSGGVAYVLDVSGQFAQNCNQEMVDIEKLELKEDIAEVRELVSTHVNFTNSELGINILSKWDAFESLFLKVMPRDYRKVLDALKRVEEKGLTGDEAALAAFHEAVS